MAGSHDDVEPSGAAIRARPSGSRPTPLMVQSTMLLPPAILKSRASSMASRSSSRRRLSRFSKEW